MRRTIEIMKIMRPMVTVASLYIASDWILDATLCYLLPPLDWYLYAMRYGAVVTYYVWKLKKSFKKRLILSQRVRDNRNASDSFRYIRVRRNYRLSKK